MVSVETVSVFDNPVVEIDSSIRFPNICRNSEIHFLGDKTSKMIALVTEVIGNRVILQKNIDIIKKMLRVFAFSSI